MACVGLISLVWVRARSCYGYEKVVRKGSKFYTYCVHQRDLTEKKTQKDLERIKL